MASWRVLMLKPANHTCNLVAIGQILFCTSLFLFLSDSCSQGTKEDKSGPNLKIIVEKCGVWPDPQVECAIVPDDKGRIKDQLVEWTDDLKLELILTTGGTGFAPSDVTPEATREVIEKEAPGLSVSMLLGSLKITHTAVLSRAVCGIRKKTLIVNMPGSSKASQECFEMIQKALPHALDLINDRTSAVKKTHDHVQSPDSQTPKTGQEATSGRAQTSSQQQAHTHAFAAKTQVSCDHENIHPGEHHGVRDPGFAEANFEGGHDTSRVAHRPRESPYPIISVHEAIATVMKEAQTGDIYQLHYRDALGHVLAEDVFAKEPLPPFPASIKDGYAVKASDGKGPRIVLGDSLAGKNPQSEVIPGYTIRISTGAQVPIGADAVVQVENTDMLKDADGGREELEVFINKAPTVGQDIRPVGSDIAKGEKVLQAGICLGAAELGLLATVGVTDVKCFVKPVVGIMSTGTELVDPGQRLMPGQIRDANRTTLMAAAQEAGFPVVDLGIAPDTVESLVKHLRTGLDNVDVIVTSGGVSMGEKDLLKDVLMLDFKATLHFARVFMKPGKPTTFATLKYNGQKKLLFCLPGNPVSATVTCHLYVTPCLRHMAGYPHPNAPIVKARLSADVKLDPRPEYHRCILSWQPDNPLPLVESTGNQISSRLLSLRAANALMMLPPKTSELNLLVKGTLVDCLLLKY